MASREFGLRHRQILCNKAKRTAQHYVPRKYARFQMNDAKQALERFLRTTAECFACLSHRLGIRPSVTLVTCIKTVQAKITK